MRGRQAAPPDSTCQRRPTTFRMYFKITAIQGCCIRGANLWGDQGGLGMRASHVACLAVASCLIVQGCGGTAFVLPPVSDREALLAAEEIDANPALPQFPRSSATYRE